MRRSSFILHALDILFQAFERFLLLFKFLFELLQLNRFLFFGVNVFKSSLSFVESIGSGGGWLVKNDPGQGETSGRV